MTTVLLIMLCLTPGEDPCLDRQVWLAGTWEGEHSAEECERARKARLREPVEPGLELVCETTTVEL